MEKDILIAMATADQKEPVEGAKSGYKCHMCGIDVTLGPASQRLLETQEVELRCSRCFKPEEVTEYMLALPPGTVAEIIQHQLRKARN